jgi:riboflavin kinase/FMN adenylyltransferase
MKLVHTAAEVLPGKRKVCLAIGVFDGAHLGHQQIIRQTVSDARQQDALALVVTFDRHPGSVVAPDRVPPLLYSLPQKSRALEALGTDALLIIRFDQAFSSQPGETFIRQLADDLGRIHSICVGADFVFGHRRSGNVALLRQLGSTLEFEVHGLPAVALDGQTVSSTRIREAVSRGDFDAATHMLGRPYSIAGPVVHGDRLGHQLGFPTANLEMTGRMLPPNGVYAANVTLSGKLFQAVLNIGHRPTLNSPTPVTRVEAHLLDFSGDLYERELEVFFVRKLRDERKFPSLDELKARISLDIAEARSALTTGPGISL